MNHDTYGPYVGQLHQFANQLAKHGEVRSWPVTDGGDHLRLMGPGIPTPLAFGGMFEAANAPMTPEAA